VNFDDSSVSEAETQKLPKVSHRKHQDFRDAAIDVREGAMAVVVICLAIAMVLIVGITANVFYEVVIK
jgi:hypothetical protein